MSTARADGELADGGETVTGTPGTVCVTADGQRVRVRWHPCCDVTRTALFRVVTDDRVAVLQHIRRVETGEMNTPGTGVDDDAALDDVPRVWVATVRDLGFTPAEEVPA